MVSAPDPETPGDAATTLPDRLAHGWELRFVAEGKRAEEMMTLYRELGFEVAGDPVVGADTNHTVGDRGEDCDACRAVAEGRFTAIYTRRPPSRDTAGDGS